MPIPFLIAGLGLAAGIIGASEHKSAKETNEEAERKMRNAQSMYNHAKESFEEAQESSKQALVRLGNTKIEVLNSSIKQFVRSFERIKHVQLEASTGLYEISNFKIDEQDVVQLKEMSDIYSDSVSSGVAGVATGAVIALAASGSLSAVTGTLSIAGSMLALGNVGVAAGYAGAALSTAVSATPFAAIAAPVILFTGISASMKADENLEKARAIYAQAEKACEEMEISKTLCEAVAERSEMYNNLLNELDSMFSECINMLEDVISKKTGQDRYREIETRELSVDELRLAAVTGSLAKAIKSVIDTPILKGEKLSENALDVYTDTQKCLPKFAEDVHNVKEAKELNGKAQKILNDARELYDDSRKAMEKVQVDLSDMLLELGCTKKKILYNAMETFLTFCGRIEGIQINKFSKLWENAYYIIDEQKIRQLEKIMNIYSVPVPRERIGIEEGTIIALAAGGFQSVKAGMLSIDEDGLNVSNIEMVAGIDDIALAYGASMVPLDWISILEVSFDGISPKMKAKDNYENARRIFDEVKTVSARMERSTSQCISIIQRAENINRLLNELQNWFLDCSNILNEVIRKKSVRMGIEIFREEDFTRQELELVNVTEALAGIITEIIITSLLNINGTLSKISQDVYEYALQSMPEFREVVSKVKSYGLVRKNIAVSSVNYKSVNRQSSIVIKDNDSDITEMKKVNRKAIISLILGIISWIGIITVIIPIIAGIWSLVDAIKALKGKTKYVKCAWIGLILSLLILIFLIAIIIMVI